MFMFDVQCKVIVCAFWRLSNEEEHRSHPEQQRRVWLQSIGSMEVAKTIIVLLVMIIIIITIIKIIMIIILIISIPMIILLQ